jgi:hypothetical protein
MAISRKRKRLERVSTNFSNQHYVIVASQMPQPLVVSIKR